jgi:putative methionine-R-sulfoxide reductase with GAF domain
MRFRRAARARAALLPIAGPAAIMARMRPRDYQAVAQLVAELPAATDRTGRMQAVVDALWERLSATGLSWVGFYTHAGGAELVLGPRRDKPACSPIGLHGVCGQAFVQRRAIVVRDVRALGSNYIACDPRDRSELVVPLLARDGSCWGVLDVDSWDVGAFGDHDTAGLERVLQAAGLMA